MKIKGYFEKEGLDEIIRDVNKYNLERIILFYDLPEYDEDGGFTLYECLYPSNPSSKINDFSKSEMLYLQKHGFVIVDECMQIVNVKTLKE